MQKNFRDWTRYPVISDMRARYHFKEEAMWDNELNTKELYKLYITNTKAITHTECFHFKQPTEICKGPL